MYAAYFSDHFSWDPSGLEDSKEPKNAAEAVALYNRLLAGGTASGSIQAVKNLKHWYAGSGDDQIHPYNIDGYSWAAEEAKATKHLASKFKDMSKFTCGWNYLSKDGEPGTHYFEKPGKHIFTQPDRSILVRLKMGGTLTAAEKLKYDLYFGFGKISWRGSADGKVYVCCENGVKKGMKWRYTMKYQWFDPYNWEKGLDANIPGGKIYDEHMEKIESYDIPGRTTNKRAKSYTNRSKWKTGKSYSGKIGDDECCLPVVKRKSRYEK